MTRLAVLSLICFAAAFAADEAKLKRVPAKARLSHEGKDVYGDHCAVCHGMDGRGNGPAVAALKASPGDLTLISRRNGGRFPVIRLQRMLSGEGDEIVAHGSREMPMWGQIFRLTSPHPDAGKAKVYNLVKHLESMQAK